MADATETGRTSEAILSIASGQRSYEQITVLSGENLAANEVVGIVTASGKVVSYDNDADDGSEVAVGIVVADCDASSADTSAVIIARDAEISKEAMVWGAAITAEAEKTAAYNDLNTAGIIVRD